MTFPVIESSADNSGQSGTNWGAQTMPSGIVAGDLLIALVSTDGGDETITFTGGWTKLQDGAGASDGSHTMGLAWKKAVGSDTLTVGIGSNEGGSCRIWRISGVDVDGTPITEGAVTTTVSAATTVAVAICDPGVAADYLWLALNTADRNRTWTSAPTGYQAQDGYIQGSGSGGAGLSYGDKDLNASSDDPDVFTWATGDGQTSILLAIHPAPSGTINNVTLQDLDSVAVTDPADTVLRERDREYLSTLDATDLSLMLRERDRESLDTAELTDIIDKFRLVVKEQADSISFAGSGNSDDFTDTNGVALATHDSNWASIGQTGTTDRYAVGGFEVQSNQCQSTGTFTWAGARYTASTDVNSSEVIIRASDHADSHFGVCVQATSARRGYWAYFTGLTGDIFDAVNLREDDGSAENWRAGQGGLSIDRTSDITLKIYIDGDDIVVDVDGTERIRWEDLTPLSGGDPGFFHPNVNSVVFPFDDWSDGTTGSADTLIALRERIRVALSNLAATDSSIELRLRDRVLLSQALVIDNAIATYVGSGSTINNEVLSDALATIDAITAITERRRLLAEAGDSSNITFFWTCESTTLGGGDYSAGDTTATANGAPEISSTYARAGTNSVRINNIGENYQFDVASDIYAEEGSFACSIYLATWDQSLVIRIDDADVGGNYVYITLVDPDEIKLELSTDGAGSNAITTTDANLTTGNWYGIVARWNKSAGDMRLEIYDANGDLQGTPVEDLGINSNYFPVMADIDRLRVGDAGAGWPDLYIDNVLVSNSYDEPLEDNLAITSFSEYGGAAVSPTDTAIAIAERQRLALDNIPFGSANSDNILFYWTCESTTFDSDDYSAGDSTPTVNSTAAINNAQVKIGSNSMDCPTPADYYHFDVASDIGLIDGCSGFWFYMSAFPGNDKTMFRLEDTGNSSNYIRVGLLYGTGDGDGEFEVRVRRSGQGNTGAGTTTVNAASGNWYFILPRWSQANGYLRIEVYDTNMSLLDTGEDLAVNTNHYPLQVDLDRIVWGNHGSTQNGDYALDNIFVSDTYGEPLEDNALITSINQYGGVDADTIIPLRERIRAAIDNVEIQENLGALRKHEVEILNNVVALTDDVTATYVAGGGDVINNVTKTDTLEVTDALTALRERIREALDTAAATDSLAPERERARQLLDSLAVTDSRNSYAVSNRTLADSVAVIDAAVILRQRARNLLDTIVLLDSIAAQSTGVTSRTLSDAVAVTDLIIPLRELSRALADNLETTDHDEVVLSGAHTDFNDAAGLVDSAAPFGEVDSLVGHLVRNLTDGSEGFVTTNTSNNVTAPLSGGIENLWDIGDNYEVVRPSVYATRHRNRALIDSLAAIDFQIAITERVRTLLSNAVVTDDTIELRERNRILAEAFAVVDSVIADYIPPGSVTYNRILQDLDTTVTDSSIELRERIRAILNAVDVTDSATATYVPPGSVIYPVTLSDNLSVIDFSIELRERIRLYADALNVSDNVIITALGITSKTLLDDLTVSDLLVMRRNRDRLLTDSITGIVDSLSRYRVRMQEDLDELDVTDTDEIVFTGQHDSTNNNAFLRDNNPPFFPLTDVLKGYRVKNLTDGSEASITSNNLLEVYGTLAGGTENLWDVGDDFEILRPRVEYNLYRTRQLTDALETTDQLLALRLRYRELFDSTDVIDSVIALYITEILNPIITAGLETLAVDHEISTLHIDHDVEEFKIDLDTKHEAGSS